MTVSTSATSVTVLGNGAQTVFNYGFIIPNAGVCTLLYTDGSGNQTPLYPGTFSLTGLGSATGGTFTYPVTGDVPPIAAGTTLTLTRDVPYTQETSLANQGAMYPAVIEGGLDALELQIQQLAEVPDRAIQTNPADLALPNPLPIAALRANGLLGFDSAGQPVIIAANNQSTQTVTALGGSASATLAQRFGTILNVKDDFGAKGDGVTDDSNAILACQAAIVARGGGIVFYPPGIYATSKTIAVTSSNVRHVGSGRGGNHDTSPVVTAATQLLWIGANGGLLCSVAPAPGGQRIVGWGFEDMALVSGAYPYASAAAIGCLLSSCAFGKLKVTTIEFIGQAVATVCEDGLAENNLMQFNDIDIVARQVNTSGTILQMAGNASASSNTCFNRVWLAGEYQNGIGIDLMDGDNNTFYETYLQLVAGGAGTPMILRGTSAGSTPGSARNNVFLHFSQSIFGGQIVSEGVGTYGTRFVSAPALNNQIVFFDRSNGPYNVSQGTNSTIYAGFNDCPFGQAQSYLGNQTGYKADVRGEYEVWGSAGALAANSTTRLVFPNGLNLPNGIIYSVSASINGTTPGKFSVAGADAESITITVDTAGVWNWRMWGR